MTLADTYLARNGGDKLQAASALAFDLMQDDPSRFKAGYSFDNAARAAADLFGVELDEVEATLRELVRLTR